MCCSSLASCCVKEPGGSCPSVGAWRRLNSASMCDSMLDDNHAYWPWTVCRLARASSSQHIYISTSFCSSSGVPVHAHPALKVLSYVQAIGSHTLMSVKPLCLANPSWPDQYTIRAAPLFSRLFATHAPGVQLALTSARASLSAWTYKQSLSAAPAWTKVAKYRCPVVPPGDARL